MSKISHAVPGKGLLAGVDPTRQSYSSRVTFDDPARNTWIVQEI